MFVFWGEEDCNCKPTRRTGLCTSATQNVYHQQLLLLCFCCCPKRVFLAELRVLHGGKTCAGPQKKISLSPSILFPAPAPALTVPKPGQPQRLGRYCRNWVKLGQAAPLGPTAIFILLVSRSTGAAGQHNPHSCFPSPFSLLTQSCSVSQPLVRKQKIKKKKKKKKFNITYIAKSVALVLLR